MISWGNIVMIWRGKVYGWLCNHDMVLKIDFDMSCNFDEIG